MNQNKKILALVGGISKGSINQKLFKAMQEIAPHDYQLEQFDLSQIPFFSQDLEVDPPGLVNQLKEKIKEAHAILFITPEYNRSFPGVFKNAIDWASRPYGQSAWVGKRAGVMGASVGNIGTFGAQHHLRQVLAYLDMKVMGQPEFYLNASHAFDDQGKLMDVKIKELMINYWKSFDRFIYE